MRDTYLENSSKEKSKFLVDGYNENGELAPKSKSPLLGGGGGMLSTLPDLIKFMKFQFESNNPLIKESTRTLFENADDDKLGYLWDVDSAESEGFYYMKTGTSFGIQSVILICPDSKYGLILLANSTSEKAFKDWTYLYDKVETDLIMYPKLNLDALLKEELVTKPVQAFKKYEELIKMDEIYYSTEDDIQSVLKKIGYEYISENKTKKAIDIFKLMVLRFRDNSKAYDCLGEAYFMDKDYENASINYSLSLELDPNNENAELYLHKIKDILSTINLNKNTMDTNSITTLKSKLDARKKNFELKADAHTKKIYKEGLESVENSGILDVALQVGDIAPNFTLNNAVGHPVELYEYLKKGKVILTWYRGGWCPYCNLKLHELQNKLSEFEALGANLIAVSPELPDKSLSTSEKHELKFEVLSDIGNKIGKEYGIVFKLTEDVADAYNKSFALNDYNGDDSNELPLPATYIIDQNGTIIYAFLDADYRNRAEPEELVKFLKANK